MKFAENIAEISKLNPDFMGFIFYRRSRRFMKGTPANKYLKGIKKVGVFVKSSQEEIKKQSEKYSLDYLQLHGNQTTKFCENLYKNGMKIIKVFAIDDNFSFKSIENYMSSTEYFLFDTKTPEYGGSGKKFSWEKLSEYNFDIPFFLSGGIAPQDAEILKKISHPQFFGVDLNSCFEYDTGLKDFFRLKKFMEIMRS